MKGSNVCQRKSVRDRYYGECKDKQGEIRVIMLDCDAHVVIQKRRNRTNDM